VVCWDEGRTLEKDVSSCSLKDRVSGLRDEDHLVQDVYAL
jgi:hypothetical protein